MICRWRFVVGDPPKFLLICHPERSREATQSNALVKGSDYKLPANTYVPIDRTMVLLYCSLLFALFMSVLFFSVAPK